MNKKISISDKIFVAGSTGMVGKSVTNLLRDKGYGSEDFGGALLTPPRSELDLNDNDAVKKWFELNRPTVVILAAAKVGGIVANNEYPADFLIDNLRIQTNVIENAYKFGVGRLLFLGSSCIYPKFSKQPIKEEELLSGKLEFTNEPYAIAKIAGIKLCQAFRRQHNFDAISLMPTNLYGPGDNYHQNNSHVFASLISKFCHAKKNNLKKVICWGTGEPLREFLHVDDLARAILFLLENWNPFSNSYSGLNENNYPLDYINIGTGKDISIFDLANKIAKFTNFKGEIIWDKSKPDGTPRKSLNIDRITKMGWRPIISLDEGIIRTIKEYRESNY
jgi:GDP-L-fucose synthase